jgi:hypothetical protein
MQVSSTAARSGRHNRRPPGWHHDDRPVRVGDIGDVTGMDVHHDEEQRDHGQHADQQHGEEPGVDLNVPIHNKITTYRPQSPVVPGNAPGGRFGLGVQRTGSSGSFRVVGFTVTPILYQAPRAHAPLGYVAVKGTPDREQSTGYCVAAVVSSERVQGGQ